LEWQSQQMPKAGSSFFDSKFFLAAMKRFRS